MEYKEYELGELIEYRNEKLLIENVSLENYISTENLLPNRNGKQNAEKLPNTKSVKKYYENDILISNIRPYFKKIWQAEIPGGASNDVLILNSCSNNTTNDYLYYYLSQDKFFDYMTQTAKGTKMPRGDKKAILGYEIKVPNIKHIQNYIVNLGKNIDKKIETNKKIIANLEELSQTIFKHWFVDFEFPDENGNPYKSSGGEMVDSELGKIPKGWECVYLKDIVHHKKDTFNPKKSNESEVKHFSLPAFDSGQYPTIDYVTDIKSNKWIIDENCILFSKMNPTTRRIWVTLYNENFLNVASSEFVVLKSDSSYRNAFIYNICISDKFNEYLVSNTTGSTNSRQRVKPDIAVQYRFAYNEEVSYLLSEKIEPYIEKIKIIREQNQNLTQLRDTLLPKLMSGEIEIPDDIEVNEDELSI
ncbi:restriction endonuclease subunit S [Staphylococcus pseudintermedius]|nr:restriction endonuclease subunit S [Staphylococcus pseudintermedius]EGQ1311986.1 restriction endonuclease subunit S [Staphylococcus pseudintermedius]EGQ1671775.1 restriction endonuclease subunit S [Staphylococcus pseudintermedius]EGQ1779719.1 restriction endonuclease subunit S [Staphylococcus pseudintermedius]EGQ2773946.1 restriction endonuclease subunit S [Staphylococcus pseudintermedius]